MVHVLLSFANDGVELPKKGNGDSIFPHFLSRQFHDAAVVRFSSFEAIQNYDQCPEGLIKT
jgi:hypothetical protein